MRVSTALAFMLLTSFVYGQKTTLLKNVNPRAKELKHYLNKTGDSLILEGERTIYRVDIFNSGFGKAFEVKKPKTKIALNNIPVGRYVIEATLVDKLILITLLRNEPYNEEAELFVPERRVASVNNKSSSSPISKGFAEKKKPAIKTSQLSRMFSKKQEISNKIAIVDNDLNVTTEQPETSKVKIAILNKRSFNKNVLSSKKEVSTSIAPEKIRRAYWMVYETRNRHSSQRVMRIADQQLVDKMIERNNLDLRTIAGRSNVLTIWEVYDVTKFMKFKRRNRNALTTESDSYNSVPYFKTNSNENNLISSL